MVDVGMLPLDALSFATSGEGFLRADATSPPCWIGWASPTRSGKTWCPNWAVRTGAKTGEVDFVVSGLPPLIGTPNIEWLGYLPAEINNWLLFTGGLGVDAKEAEAGRALLYLARRWPPPVV